MPFNIQNKEENQQASFGLLVQQGLVEDFKIMLVLKPHTLKQA